jgi:transcriptional regulator with XRE-family HTH domain
MSPVAYRDVAAAFGCVLKTARAGVGVTQEKLSELADIDRTYPSLLERGLREPGLGVVIRIGEALQVDPVLLVRMTLLRLQRTQDV